MTARVALTKIQSTAIHEAGHATVAAHLGLPVQRVALWECHRGGFEGVVDYLHGESAIFDDVIFDDVAIAAAGRAAISLIDPACSFELFFADGPYPPWQPPGSRFPSFERMGLLPSPGADETVQLNPDPARLQVRLSDWQQAHALIDRLEPAPSYKRRRRILASQWDRSREICRQRWEGVVALANALLAAYEAEEPRACRANISGEKLTRLLAFAR